MHGEFPVHPNRRGKGKKKAKPPPPNPSLEMPLKFLSTSFGASYLMPPAPGTAGMLVGVVLWWVLGKLALVPFFHFVVLLAFWVAGLVICQKAEPYWGHGMASIMSFDAMVGFMIAAAPFQPDFHPNWTHMVGVIFAVYWLLDIIQPFPINMAQEAPGGFKYMLDDTMAALVALLITWGGYDAFWRAKLGLDQVIEAGAGG